MYRVLGYESLYNTVEPLFMDGHPRDHTGSLVNKRGVLISEVVFVVFFSMHEGRDSRQCPDYRGDLNSEVLNREIPLH